MTRDDASHERETESRPLRSRGDERLEHGVEERRWEAYAVVAYANGDPFLITRCGEPDLWGGLFGQRVHRVLDQVHHALHDEPWLHLGGDVLRGLDVQRDLFRELDGFAGLLEDLTNFSVLKSQRPLGEWRACPRVNMPLVYQCRTVK